MMETTRCGNRARAGVLALLAALLPSLVAGCSVNRFAANRLGDALAGSGSTFSADDDPELIAAATPFSLKLIESVLASSPSHRGLLLAAASGFTQYTYAYVQQDAERLEDSSVEAAADARARARRLYLRARDYALRGLETRHPHFTAELRADPRAAVERAAAVDVPFLYWAAASWGAAITLSKDDPESVADLPLVEALIDRALALDEGFDAGAIHAFLISYETVRPSGRGDPYARARMHFDRVVELTGGRSAGPLVAYAEAVSVPRQDRPEFERLLQRALAIDPGARPEWRLANLVVQRRARWLLARIDQLFLEGSP